MTGGSIVMRYHESAREFARAYVITMRPYLMFVSGITGIAGLTFAHDLPLWRVLAIGLASYLSYGFGQALTDCFQIDTDSISSPYRPLTRGIVSKQSVLAASIAGLTGCISLLSVFNPINAALGLAAGIGLAVYTPFKRRWWAGPFSNAWIVVVLFLMAALAGRAEGPDLRSPQCLLALSVVFFGYANFVLAGYFKDVAADRLTGYDTVLVRYGRNVSAWISDLLAVITILAAAAIALRAPAVSPAALCFLGLAIVASVFAQLRLHQVRTDAMAYRAISPVVYSYLLLLSGVAAIQKPDWSAPLALFCAAFAIVMKFRPERSQI